MKNNYDLVVVGTGFASTFFLKKYLSKAKRNARVLVLERGHFIPRAQRAKILRGEDSPYAHLNIDPRSSFINQTPEKHWLFTLGFGGSSNCWYACTPRFMPSDFQMKSMYGVGEDWPVQYDELEQYYTEVEDLMAIAGPEDTPFPMSRKYPLPPHQFTAVDKIMKRNYGNLYINQPTARASKSIQSRNACCANSACSVCPVDAKFTIENSAFGVYEDPRIELRYGTHVFSLDLGQGIVKGVNYVFENQEHSVTGDAIALGTHALFNAHILLNSGDGHPLTGKGLGEQYGMDVVVHLDNLANVGGSTWVNANGYMMYDGEHRKSHAACLIESNNAPYIRVERGKWRNVATFRLIFEDLPQDQNYVTTGEDKLKPVVHFAGISEYTQRAVKHAKETLPKLLSCLPVEEVRFMEPFRSEAHILGTTRMHADRALGVTDKHMVHHDYRNLFVLGSGAFTTATPANPTLTLSALSMYSADKMF